MWPSYLHPNPWSPFRRRSLFRTVNRCLESVISAGEHRSSAMLTDPDWSQTQYHRAACRYSESLFCLSWQAILASKYEFKAKPHIPPFLGNVTPSPREMLSIVTPYTSNELRSANGWKEKARHWEWWTRRSIRYGKTFITLHQRRDAEVDPIDRSQSGSSILQLNDLAPTDRYRWRAMSRQV